jgi:hypothetical protein
MAVTAFSRQRKLQGIMDLANRDELMKLPAQVVCSEDGREVGGAGSWHSVPHVNVLETKLRVDPSAKYPRRCASLHE